VLFAYDEEPVPITEMVRATPQEMSQQSRAGPVDLSNNEDRGALWNSTTG
jgi:hypothetical protein